MKVKLLMNVTKLGNKGDIVETSDNYAVNVLLKTGKAVRATEQIIKAKQAVDKVKQEAKEKEGDAFVKFYERLKAEPLIFKKKIDNKGHLYAKLSPAEVTDAIFEKYKLSIDPKSIEIPTHESLGEINVGITNKSKKYYFICVLK